MRFPRQYLPSTAVLCAFEAAARLGSFTTAASELSLTQSAVSRQIRALEEALGAELFVRERQTVRLTLAGENYALQVRDALTRIANASLEFRASPTGGALNLALPPTFGARWLVPRLPAFRAAHPDIAVNLVSQLHNFEDDGVDAAIQFGEPQRPGTESARLMGERVLPLCSPALRTRHAFAQALELLDAPLLHLESRPDAWERWFRAQGVDVGRVPGMLVDQYEFVGQAALAGLGVGLLPTFMFEAELAAGRLVPAWGEPQASTGCYHLMWPVARAAYFPLTVFRQWLLDTCAAEAGP
ncbi:LysR family transcriptional regulator [Verticiella sediminum]|uniref:LysR family transcriptional regulator n=1 Tax=Verticiella sediminum TaxID=1247510 RepID=A0A556B1I0_9BURK|nr:LysR substrate-binding domain-containing protein [Verticiella sediminum]TSH99023.1 LysR family transcriptional regulator [Verticiella sediminum]